jgi:parallel beta-helix repeat protein
MRIKLSLSVAIIFLAHALFSQTTRYVATTGNDNTGTGTIGNPYKTITKAASFLQAGDILYVRGGTYTNANYNDGNRWKNEETAEIANLNGTASQYITIKPYPNETVILRGDGSFIIQIRSCSYIKVEGFEVYGETENIPLGNPTTDDPTKEEAYDYQFAFRRGTSTTTEYRLARGRLTDATGLEDLSGVTVVRPYYYFTHGIVVQNSDHVEVLKNTVHHMPGEGIRLAGSDYIKVIGNDVHNCARRSSTGVHGISCYTLKSLGTNNNDQTIEITNNIVHENYCELTSWSEGKTIYTATIDEGKGITVQRCYSDLTTSPTNSLGKWTYHRILIQNNITYRNGFSGLHVNTGDRVDIINNTSYLDCQTGHGNQLGVSVQGSNDVKIYNNLINTNTALSGFSISLGTSTGVIVQNNMVNGDLDPDVDAIDGTSTTIGNPLFTNPNANNFSLMSASPAINKALTNAPSTDFYGNVRVGIADIGAIEYSPIVPVELRDFKLKQTEKTTELTWQTASEINNKQFEIERSTDAKTWQNIGIVAGQGTSNTPKTYAFTDEKPQSGINYYRLRQVDFDGKFELSAVLSTNFSSKSTPSVFPNPFTKSIVVNGVNDNETITIFDALGRQVAHVKAQGNSMELDLEQLPSNAVYIVKTSNSAFKILKK